LGKIFDEATRAIYKIVLLLYNYHMELSSLEQKLKILISRSRVMNISTVAVRVIVNPFAGGFSRALKFEQTHGILDKLLAETEELPEQKPISWEVLTTTASRHATQIANDLLEKAALQSNQQWLVILACGDGTTWEFLDGLTRAPAEIVERFTILRLPLGTGNDGTDGWTLEDSLSRLFDEGVILKQPYVTIHTAKQSKQSKASPSGFRAFNIVSIGLDAFVAHMTNKLKKKLPGDSFKLWLDLATVFYDSIYKTGTMKIVGKGTIATIPSESTRKYAAHVTVGTDQFTIEGRFLLLAVGADGRRTYGSHQFILPDENNVCLIEKMSLFRKIKLKTPIVSGEHKKFPEVILAQSRELTVYYDETILMQMDGESIELSPEDFPLVIKVSEPILRYLGRKDGKRHV